ncbi:MAG: ABC transporter ATP-binding protein [Oscillospiraceae bacterium]|nr:ABC transporter ATP-binding protein [Oscillospiraceae bacterium]
MDIVCKLNDIEKKYGSERVLGPVSVSFERGTVTGIAGPNGAGKSTLLSVAAGIIAPDSGTRWTAGGRICYVPQELALYPSLSCRDNLSFWAGVYGLNRKLRKSRIASALELVELTDKAEKTVETLSGGMKRRLNIAAALLAPSELLLMDEPTAGCDARSVDVILRTISHAADNYCSVVFVSHSADELRICSKVIYLEDGLAVRESAR